MVFWAVFGGAVAGGALILTAVVLSTWLRRRTDMPRLRIRATVGSIHNIPDFKGQQLFFITAANVGPRPVTIAEFGYVMKGTRLTRHAYVSSSAAHELGWGLPKEIAPGRSIDHFIEVGRLLRFLEKDEKRPSDLKSVYYRDQAGRFHTGPVPHDTLRVLEERFEEWASTR